MQSECAYSWLLCTCCDKNLLSGKRKYSQYKPKSDRFSTIVKDAAVVPQTDNELELDETYTNIRFARDYKFFL